MSVYFHVNLISYLVNLHVHHQLYHHLDKNHVILEKSSFVIFGYFGHFVNFHIGHLIGHLVNLHVHHQL